jgi:hypothetical protein
MPDLTTAPVQTSVPDWVMTYCRQLSEVHFNRKLNRMYLHMLQCFLANEPWKASPPFPWRAAKIHRSSGLNMKKGSDPGWAPMNMVLPQTLIDQISHVIEAVNNNSTDEGRALSKRTFLYTVVCWWITFVYPYKGPGVLDE